MNSAFIAIYTIIYTTIPHALQLTYFSSSPGFLTSFSRGVFIFYTPGLAQFSKAI